MCDDEGRLGVWIQGGLGGNMTPGRGVWRKSSAGDGWVWELPGRWRDGVRQCRGWEGWAVAVDQGGEALLDSFTVVEEPAAAV